ncbi:GNAT family N-acetyltransferase [Roseateles amylovorans]|uniref:GNAT family N-acetyltransferase n=1 Tax=Roseateles amylovorans TaxID=2978473 RepID=A0ABY6B4U6_9BURK|nr:GNAT family N-acetyltransferase [Roseateles amylovorans]UXH80214.1 GNAT family N-acetyltransferase [Roseateles amylovorans]
MTQIRRSSIRKRLHQALRLMFSRLPRPLRFGVYRRMADCDPAPSERLELKVAETQEELDACFRILHDAYVGSGFMKPDPSGLRVTIYHALPTTTTLCAKYDGVVVGTISMVREGVFGFPLQSVFDLEGVRAKGGKIAEISALAVAPAFRKTGGAILFPLMKFMHQYCTEYFDTRHLVIAVNPDKIELYEALLFFTRLREQTVANYDFANGAPAVGATLDLQDADRLFERGYRGRPAHKNLHTYFFRHRLPNIKLPERRYHTTNDPVMTPALLDHFFNQVVPVFPQLSDRQKALLWSVYRQVEFRHVLPMLTGGEDVGRALRQYPRYSIRCPGFIDLPSAHDGPALGHVTLDVIEVSAQGFQAECKLPLPLQIDGHVEIQLGHSETSHLTARAVRRRDTDEGVFYGFRIDEPDRNWRSFVSALEMGQTARDLAA